MRARRISLLLILPLFLASLVFSQSLAEIAKQERERREALKGKKAVVVTNADLARMKKKPALEVPAAEGQPAEAGGAETPEPAPASQPAAETAQPGQGLAAEEPESAPSQEKLRELQSRWEKAKEYVELLTLKMGALWQEYYGLESSTAKEAIQQSISETFLKLEKAQEDEILARRGLERFLGQQKKETTPTLWIR